MLKRLSILGLLLLVAAAGAAWWWARGSLPVLDGELRMAGLRGPVEVQVDDRGVPHLYAREPDDAWFAAGVFHARDRLWQMELYRRVADGRLSELFGEATIAVDKRFRTLGLRAAAEAEWERLGPSGRSALSRYAEGVNAVLASETGRRRPLEMQILGVTPAPWTPADSLVVGRLLAWRLAENHQAELVRAAVGARVGTAEAQRLAGRYPADAPAVLPGPGADVEPVLPLEPLASAGTAAPIEAPDAPAGREATLAERPRLPDGLEWLEAGARRGNSNNWVIAGRRTVSGRPILANDPHLQMEFPSVWYELHIVAAGLDVAGVSVPGSPFVIIGHNARVAWGLTNSNADVQDLYLERIDVGRRRYLYRGEWVPVEISTADISVRGRAEPERFEVWRTRHGAVFADVGLDWDAPPAWLSPASVRSGEQRAYVLRWAALDGDMAEAFDMLNRAGSWPEFLAAVERFDLPSLNFVYADTDGNIGYAMSGVLPIRALGDGTRPVDGWTGEGEWAGRTDSTKLPRAFNPESGYLTSANNEIDRSWPGLVTRDWAAPFRATRLDTRLSEPQPMDLDQAARLQADVRSLAADRVLAGAADAVAEGRRRQSDAAAIELLERVIAWDRVVDGRPVVSMYQALEHALWRRTFVDELGEPLFNRFYEWAGAERLAGLFAVIDEPRSRWFDDIGTVDRRETRDDIYLLAALDAAERLRERYGAESEWAWSSVHVARFEHPLGNVAFPLRWLFNRGPVQMIGDGTTVLRVSFHRLRPFDAWEVPSWRQVLDVGDWDGSRVTLPTGQSGHPLSPHYFDQNELWREGRYRPQPYSRAAVERARAHRLVLVP
jgi:penicillin amidase